MNIAKPIYQSMLHLKQQNRKAFAVLIDPDKINIEKAEELGKLCAAAAVDYIFFGGSLMLSNHVDDCINAIKNNCTIPVVLFPGNPNQLSKKADGLLYLSLISGRNPDLLIGQHVVSAPIVKQSGLEVISTGYIVVDGGAPTTVSYMSGSLPIPYNKADIAVCTAMAGEMQGKHVIYMDSGSGAPNAISEVMINSVSKNINIPLIVGGGVRDAATAIVHCKAGADIVVVGNAIEKDISLINNISNAIHNFCSE